MRGEETRNSGVHYLEYEPLEVQVRGKVWKVFGSPVCRSGPVLVSYKSTHSFPRLLHDTPSARSNTRPRMKLPVRALSSELSVG